MAPTVLIVGATRGLGASLASKYLARGCTVLGTSRSASPPSSPAIHWLPSIDLSKPTCGSDLASAVKAHAPIDIAYVTAGLLQPESFDKPDWDAELKMYTICAIGPVFVVQALVKAGLIKEKGGKVVLLSSEAGSVGLRHESEGGGMYGHHASKAACNMVGHLRTHPSPRREDPMLTLVMQFRWILKTRASPWEWCM